jgi:DNA topoisomerase-1
VHKTKRIVFREITKPAIQKAVQVPRTIDLNLVDAQQARRVLDRLVGYELSETLWRKVRGKLSAGRVQSVAVKLVVDRERDIQKFNITPFFKVNGFFDVVAETGRTATLKAESPGQLDTVENARSWLESCRGAAYSVAKIEIKPAKRRPAPPFTTSTLQQEASRKLGFAVNRTMSNAQRLYEAGFISYMRTDSTSLSETAIQAIAAEITSQFGARYLQTRRFKTGSESAQEAHEAIRPTYIENKVVTEDRDMQRLYELIWKRAIASQMADAELERTVVDVSISTRLQDKLVAEGEVIKFDGFLKVYLESTDDDDEDTKGMLPPLVVGQGLPLQKLTASERFTRPPARYTEAGLVKKLEELGIGRPSTYAPTISRIMEEGRGYVVKESRPGKERTFRVMTLTPDDKLVSVTDKENYGAGKNNLYPTDMGMLVSDFLSEHFDQIMDYGFTADIEKQFDHIAEGKEVWNDMIRRFYTPFHDLVENTKSTASRADMERVLGVDPLTGRTVLARMGRYGALVQIGAPDELAEGEKPQYANLNKDQSIETISFEDAVALFALPKNLGTLEDLETTVGAGRYGPFVKWGDTYISLPKGVDPLGVDATQALELIAAHKAANAAIAHYQDLPITKGKGRFGLFVKWSDLYINIPKACNFDTLTAQQAVELVLSKLEKEANRYIRQWPEEKIAIENGRWGPFIRFGKESVALPKTENGKMTSDQAGQLSLEQVKAIITEAFPEAFTPKKKATKKK